MWGFSNVICSYWALNERNPLSFIVAILVTTLNLCVSFWCFSTEERDILWVQRERNVFEEGCFVVALLSWLILIKHLSPSIIPLCFHLWWLNTVWRATVGGDSNGTSHLCDFPPIPYVSVRPELTDKIIVSFLERWYLNICLLCSNLWDLSALRKNEHTQLTLWTEWSEKGAGGAREQGGEPSACLRSWGILKCTVQHGCSN